MNKINLIKNVKVYDRLNKEKNIKKRHKSRFKIILASLAITVSLVLTGCGITASQQRILDAANNTPTAEYVQQSTEHTSIEETINIDDVNGANNQYYDYIMNQQVSFDEFDSLQIKEVTDGINPQYPYTDISNVSKLYEKYQKLPELEALEVSQKIIKGELTAKELFDIVKVNNASYREKNRYTTRVDLDDDYIMRLCSIICDTLKAEIPKLGSTDNYDDISYNIMNLCIFKSSTTANASVTNDGCLLASPTQIANMEAIVQNADTEAIIIAHETQHLMQKIATPPQEKVGIKESYGFCVRFEDSSVNSLYYDWLIESSAEKLATDLYNADPTTYKSKIAYLDLFTLVLLPKSSVDIDSLARTTQQSNIEPLFYLFNANTETEKIEILNMMYAVEVIQQEPAEFYSVIENQMGKKISKDEVDIVDIPLKNSLFQTLSKVFYKNISSNLQSNPSSIEDIFKLIAVYENGLSKHISYSDETRFNEIREFMESYISIQDSFFQQIANKTGVSIEEIKNCYNQYSENLEVPKTSVFLENLSVSVDISTSLFNAKENDFFNKYFENIANRKASPINMVYENLLANYQK